MLGEQTLMPGSPYEIARKSVEALPPADQLRLVAELVSQLSDGLDREARSLLDLEGLGKDVWKDLDVDEYLRRERSSWNG